MGQPVPPTTAGVAPDHVSAPPGNSSAPPGHVPAPYRGPGLSPVARALIGLALLLPALVAWLWSYLVPTISTLVTSFRQETLFGSSAEWIGYENYRYVIDDGLAGQFGFALLLALLPLVFALLVAPLLALVVDRAGRAARLVARGLLALPVAAYAPVAVLLAWRAYRPDSSPGTGDGGSLVRLLATTTFGLVVAVAATAFLSALRQRAGARRVPALLTVGGLLALGTLALALQVFTAPALLTGGGREQETTTPLLGAILTTVRQARLGPSAATSWLLLVVLGVLGLAALALLLATRTRIEFDGWWDRPPARSADLVVSAGSAGPEGRSDAARPVFVGLAVLALAAFVGVVGWALAPWLGHIFGGGEALPSAVDGTTVFANTWLPPLVSALVSVGLAALAGFGIGALRPFGRWSELLLVPFAPWLFVGVGPLAVALFKRTAELDQVNSFLGLIPPSWLSIPALFVFALFFRGQQRKWRAGRGFAETLLLPALPLLAAAFLLTWLLNAEQPLWAYLVASDVKHMPGPILIQMIAARWFTVDGSALGLVLPLPMLMFLLLAFAVLQVGYLDRLAIRVGTPASEPTPGPEPTPGATAVPAPRAVPAATPAPAPAPGPATPAPAGPADAADPPSGSGA